MGRWEAKVLSFPGQRPRQFEYHPSVPDLLAFGTLDGSVVAAAPVGGRILARSAEPVGGGGGGDATRADAVLGIGWFRQAEPMFAAGTAGGSLKVFRVREDDAVLDAAALPEPGRFGKLTSVSINASDSLLLASGFTPHAAVFDVRAGQEVRRFEDIHGGNINISRFANTSPHLFATSSFDRTVKTWDLRVPGLRPLYTCQAQAPLVMCTFCPNDCYLLTSAVDNEVTQYLAVDGRAHLRLRLDKTGRPSNFTRSYYMHGGASIISGSSEQRVVRVHCSHTGRVLSTVDVFPGSRHESHCVQSLRGCPSGLSAFVVLGRYTNNAYPHELVHFHLAPDAADEPLSQQPALPSSSSLEGSAGEAMLQEGSCEAMVNGVRTDTGDRCTRELPSCALAVRGFAALYSGDHADLELHVDEHLSYPAHLAYIAARPSALRDFLRFKPLASPPATLLPDKLSRVANFLRAPAKTVRIDGKKLALEPLEGLAADPAEPAGLEVEELAEPRRRPSKVFCRKWYLSLPPCDCCGARGLCHDVQRRAVVPLLLEALYTDVVSAFAFRRVVAAVAAVHSKMPPPMHTKTPPAAVGRNTAGAGTGVSPRSARNASAGASGRKRPRDSPPDLCVAAFEAEDVCGAAWPPMGVDAAEMVANVSVGGPNGDLRAAAVVAALAAQAGGPVIAAALECCFHLGNAWRLPRVESLLERVAAACIGVETVVALLDLALRLPHLRQLRGACADFWHRHHEVVAAGQTVSTSTTEPLPLSTLFVLSRHCGNFSDSPLDESALSRTLSGLRVAPTPSLSDPCGRSSYALFSELFAATASALDDFALRTCLRPSVDDVKFACARFRRLTWTRRRSILIVAFAAEMDAARQRTAAEAGQQVIGDGTTEALPMGQPELPVMSFHLAHLGVGDLMYFFLGMTRSGCESTELLSAYHLPTGRHVRLRSRGPGPVNISNAAGAPLLDPPSEASGAMVGVGGGLGESSEGKDESEGEGVGAGAGAGESRGSRGSLSLPGSPLTGKEGAGKVGPGAPMEPRHSKCVWDCSRRYFVIVGGTPVPTVAAGPTAQSAEPTCGVWLFDTLHGAWYDLRQKTRGEAPPALVAHSMVSLFPVKGAAAVAEENFSMDVDAVRAAQTIGGGPGGAPIAAEKLYFAERSDGGVRIGGALMGLFGQDASRDTNLVVFGGKGGGGPRGPRAIRNDVHVLNVHYQPPPTWDAGAPPYDLHMFLGGTGGRPEGPKLSQAVSAEAMADETEVLRGAHAEAAPACGVSVAWVTPRVEGVPPLPRYHHAACVLPLGGVQHMLIQGGQTENRILNDVGVLEMRHPASLKWLSTEITGGRMPSKTQATLTPIPGGAPRAVLFGFDPASDTQTQDLLVLDAYVPKRGGFGLRISTPRYAATEVPRPRALLKHAALRAPVYGPAASDPGAAAEAVYVFGGHRGLEDSRVWRLSGAGGLWRWDCAQQGAMEPHCAADVILEASRLAGDLRGLRAAADDESGADLEFVNLGTSSVRAHRVVVEAGSETLRTMLASGMQEALSSKVSVEVAERPFRAMLDFIYTDTLDVASDEMLDLLICASSYGVDDLVKLLEGMMFGGFSTNNICSMVRLAVDHNLPLLEARALGFAIQHWAAVVESDGWRNLAEEFQRRMTDYRVSALHLFRATVPDHCDGELLRQEEEGTVPAAPEPGPRGEAPAPGGDDA